MAVDNFIEEHPPWQRLLSSISGGSIEIEALTVTENGTYSEEGKAYSPVTVNVSGGVTLGNLAKGLWTTETVSVGASANSARFIETTQVKIGDTVVVDSAGQAIQFVASGTDAVALYRSDNPLTFAQAYDVTVDINTGKYASVEEIDMDVVSTTMEIEGETVPAWEYTVPSIAEGHYYVLKFTE